MGRPITVSIPHKLGKGEARRRIQEGFSSMQRNQSAGWGATLECMNVGKATGCILTRAALAKVSGRLDVFGGFGGTSNRRARNAGFYCRPHIGNIENRNPKLLE